MAATAGPDTMICASTDSYDGTAPNQLANAEHTMSSQSTSLASPLASPKSSVPPPNPPFVFPTRPSSASAPSSFSRATGRRPRSAIETHTPASVAALDSDKYKPRSPALPAFSFNPGASVSPAGGAENAFLSPPQSPSVPTSPRTIPARPGHGHRRGASEFVGGSIRSGEAITVLSSSPTKSESGMASPLLQPVKPTQRRGHAHRRSAAISSHDLASIILPSPGQQLRGSSAPNSPALLDRPHRHDFPVPEVSPAQSEPIISAASYVIRSATEGAVLPVVELDQRPRPVTRNRVGFSDTLEFIPRPLSLVSSDTSSTMTARPGHSVSGSISSIISVTNLDRDPSSHVSLASSRAPIDSRPSTAGAILERIPTAQEPEQPPSSPRRRGSIPTLGPLPPPTPVSDTTPSPNKIGKKWSFFGLDPFVASSPTRSRPVSSSSSELRQGPSASTETPVAKVADLSLKEFKSDLAGLKPLTKKRSKKQRNVKGWSILSRKPKARHSKQKKRAPTPPPLRLPLENAIGSGDMHVEPEPVMPTPTLLVTESNGNGEHDTWAVPSVPDEDLSYPMIDLDAALGPFNTPLPTNPEWEAAQRAGGLTKKQLHSAAGMSRFTGPGMHYHHRRTESAPELAPMDGGRFGFPRFGSSSTMADVFEEDEEEVEGESTEKSTGQSTPVVEQGPVETSKTAATLVSAGDNSPVANIATLREDCISEHSDSTRSSSEIGESDKRPGSAKTRSSRSVASLREECVAEENFASRDVGRTDGGRSMDCSPTASPAHAIRTKELALVELAPLNLPSGSLPPISPYSMTQSSSFPSPRSPMSYDAHRISTAPSSITEDNFQSLLLGEPGPEVRISVDDIPSLTSSNSTMTRESIFANNPQARQPPFNEQPRPASFTGTAFGRRRSSLASLSRLISSSHGERSKLSMEVTMDNEPEKKTKTSKTKRLSRMVQFWKSKEGETA